MALQNPFTPGNGLAPPYLANREREIRVFRDSLQATLDGSPRHLVLFGEPSLGKTSLLLRFRRIALDQGCLAVLGAPYPTDDTETFATSIIRPLVLQIHAFYREAVWNPLTQALGLRNAAVPTLDAELRRHFTRSGDAPTSLRNFLRIIWDHTRNLAPAILIMVDDIDQLHDPDQTIALLRRALTDLALEHVNVMAVITSAPDQPDERIATSFAEFFTPVELNRLSDKEIMDALTVPVAGTPLRLDREIADRIVELAAGNPYYLQELAYHTVEMADPDYRVTPHTFELALEQTFYRVSAPIFEQRLTALSNGERHLLAVFAQLDSPLSLERITPATAAAELREDTVPQLLERLIAKGYIAQVDVPSADPHYAMPDPLFREYMRRHLDWIL